LQSLKCPYPFAGGKKKVAALIWERLGDADNVIEPFAGSLAVLLARPTPPRVETVNDQNHFISNFWRAIQADPEQVAYWANSPVSEADLHARHRYLLGLDVPTPECAVPERYRRHPLLERTYRDAHADAWRSRHPSPAAAFRERVRQDPHFFDAKFAGWFCWGICCWIGSGWCDERSQVTPEGADATSQQMPAIGSGARGLQYGRGVHGRGPADPTAKRPMLAGDNPGSYGKGVHARGPSEQLPRLGSFSRGGTGVQRRTAAGQGIHVAGPTQKLPDIGGHCGGTGRGVHQVSGPRQLSQQIPFLGGGHSTRGQGIHANPPESRPDDAAGTNARRLAWLTGWFGALSDRLRCVRVCCGDWERVCGSDSTTTRLGTVGLFLDPPYPVHTPDGKPSRAAGLYGAGDDAAAADRIRDRVLAYCQAHGPDPLFRIAICGYETDGYEALEAQGWEVVAWRSSGGYSNQSKRKNINRDRERIWFSPSCLRPESEHLPLFDRVGSSFLGEEDLR
jgi:hypothetical protein